MQAVWSAFRCRPEGHANNTLRTKGLSIKGWLELMDKAHLYDEKFGYQVRSSVASLVQSVYQATGTSHATGGVLFLNPTAFCRRRACVFYGVE